MVFQSFDLLQGVFIFKFLVDIKSDIRINNDEISGLGPQSCLCLIFSEKNFNIYQALYTLLTAEILSGKNARSMDFT